VSEFFLEILKSQGLFYGKFYGELYGAFVKRKILFFLSTKFSPEQIHGIRNSRTVSRNPKLPNGFTESETPERFHGIRNFTESETPERFHGIRNSRTVSRFTSPRLRNPSTGGYIRKADIWFGIQYSYACYRL
jgi:hypothetical protein